MNKKQTTERKILTMKLEIFKFYKFTIFTISGILILSLIKTPDIDIPINSFWIWIDKLVHFGMYAFLTFVFLWENFVRHKYHLLFNRLILISTMIIGLGIILELAQNYLTAYRYGDIHDEIANFIGLIGGQLGFRMTKNSLFLRNKIFREIT
ncbi:MAG: VanZ family protein [Breznakibacter sp.]